MNIQLLSDLHLEVHPHLSVAPAPGAQLLVLAGDIGSYQAGSRLPPDEDFGLGRFSPHQGWPTPVLYVPGNHEFYGVGWPGALTHMRRACEGTAVTLLDKDEIVIDGVRFLGATLWSDFEINRNIPVETAMRAAQTRLLDFFEIKTQMGFLQAKNTRTEHLNARSWLKGELVDKPFDGKTVVITHHAPHPLSISPRYIGDALNGAFVSNLTDLLFHADLWLHGHCHAGFDYQVGRCRVVSNPAGYVLNRPQVAAGEVPLWENKHWQPEFVIDS